MTVTALDAYGNMATGYRGTVHFTSSDGQAVLPANYTFTAADAGVHTFTGVTLKTAGKQTITATDTVTGSITGTESVTVSPAAAAIDLTVTGFPATTTAGAAHSVTVTAVDAYGNMATGYIGHGPLHQQRRPGRPAGQLHLQRRRRRASTPSPA